MQQQHVLLVFAVPAEAAADADGEDVFDPNIPAVDQDFDLLGAEVGVGYENTTASGFTNTMGNLSW
jgi:hypothetical protein